MKSITSSAPILPRNAVRTCAPICCALMLVLTGALPAFAQGEVNMPEPTGSYPVGRSIYEWTDTSRAEKYSDDPEAKRELIAWVWYPAELTPEAQPAVYLPGLLGDIVGQQFGFDVSQVHNHAYADVPLAASESAYPVLVFSGGNGLLMGTFSALLEEVASHGYVVVGIVHTYNPVVTVFSDGRIIPAGKEITGDEALAYWVEDTSFVVDQLTSLNSSDERFAGKLDLSRLGVFGHSFGGATAAEFCLLDARCQAGINVDGSLRGASAGEGVNQPFMQIFSQHPTCEEMVAAGGAPNVEACEAAFGITNLDWQRSFETAENGYQLTISGALHNSFADNFFLLPLIPGLDEGATIAPERTWRITSDYVLAFFDKHLNGEDAPLLDAASADYPEVTFEWHAN